MTTNPNDPEELLWGATVMCAAAFDVLLGFEETITVARNRDIVRRLNDIDEHLYFALFAVNAFLMEENEELAMMRQKQVEARHQDERRRLEDAPGSPMDRMDAVLATIARRLGSASAKLDVALGSDATAAGLADRPEEALVEIAACLRGVAETRSLIRSLASPAGGSPP